MDTHDRLIQALTDRSVYEHPTTEIVVLQTHISWVVLTGPYAYKIKKPVNLGFVDFSTLAQRHFFCRKNSASIAAWHPNCTSRWWHCMVRRSDRSFTARAHPLNMR